MPNFDFQDRSRDQNPLPHLTGDELALDKDLVMEQILHNLNNTPIGQVLMKIAPLTEIRTDKVLDVRRQLTEGNYDLNKGLDAALEKVLEDLIAR
jgi:hypothetical protein